MTNEYITELLASATDLLNSWARETGVQEARSESDIKGVIDRLWSHLSTRLHRLQAEQTSAVQSARRAGREEMQTYIANQLWKKGNQFERTAGGPDASAGMLDLAVAYNEASQWVCAITLPEPGEDKPNE